MWYSMLLYCSSPGASGVRKVLPSTGKALSYCIQVQTRATWWIRTCICGFLNFSGWSPQQSPQKLGFRRGGKEVVGKQMLSNSSCPSSRHKLFSNVATELPIHVSVSLKQTKKQHTFVGRNMYIWKKLSEVWQEHDVLKQGVPSQS